MSIAHASSAPIQSTDNSPSGGQGHDGPAILSLIGNAPLVRVTKIDTGPCELYLKLENQNPGGSIKDRIGLAMVEGAEKAGRLKPGGTVVEATAGNTGLGLALVCAAKGYRLVLVIPDKMAAEKINHLRALGAEIHVTRSDVGKGHPDYYQDIAERLAAETPGAVYMNQFANPDNPAAHERWTGPELLRQMDGRLDAVVVGVGSGGTLTGLGRYFRAASPRTRMVLADPQGSILRDLVKTGRHDEPGSWVVEGIGEDFVPPNCDLQYVEDAYTIPDAESLNAARELLRREGILGGSSSGTLFAAALRYCRAQTLPKRVVTLVCDTGNKYLSKMFNDGWMADQGFLPSARTGDLRDLITRRVDKGQVVTVSPDDTLLTAYKRMRISDVSQLPVMQGGRVVGLLDESDLLLHVEPDPSRFREAVREAMTSRLETVPVTAPISALDPIFSRNMVALVTEGDAFLGLLTRVDLLNHLRRQLG
ncbi:pyridoxal-phosphate dependent enzyme [Nitrospirillum sp. BR 11163]|uniref:pyridoxal-phosphate dependent enzyme n=1 Tax=Nitrospirillum sp. BR 11163 TaxID=3104323 RepID=UPI002AFFAF72|nr:pyridoxal-phosphate dependent enzyme [Nitrospirillum sp. BR 11163]MEA1676952.1 pyridoxal-phosphate dependent enzyme [Nitrospirillum sp. BR 11163]